MCPFFRIDPLPDLTGNHLSLPIMRSSTNNNNFNEDNQRGTQSPGVQDEELPDIEVPRQVPPPPIRFVPLRGHVGPGLGPRIVRVRALLRPGQPGPYVGRLRPFLLRPRLLRPVLPSTSSAPAPPGPSPTSPIGQGCGSGRPPILDLHENEDRAGELGGLVESGSVAIEQTEGEEAGDTEGVEGVGEQAEGEDEEEREAEADRDVEELNEIVPPLSPCSAKRSSNHYQAEMFFS